MKNFFSYIICLGIGLILSGCTSSVYFKTEQDPMYKIEHNKRFFVFLPKNPTIEDKKFMISLNDKLKKQGFNVVEKFPFDYAVFFTLTDKSYSGTSSYTSYVPTTSYTSGYVGSTYVTGTTTSSKPVTNTYNYTNTYKKIYVDILSGKKNNEGQYETIWSGFMSSDIGDYDKNPNAMINELVKLIGKEYKGDIYVELDK